MKHIYLLALAIITLVNGTVAFAQKANRYNAIYSGIPWFDDKGDVVSAHGGCIVKDGSRYYFFGEKHTDTANAFAGFTCYSSTDLYNWKTEGLALAMQDSGKLGPNRVGERVKVMKCSATGEYIMYLHVDTLGYKDQFVGYATAATITGPYTFKGPLLFNGKPIRKWDMGTFQDKDGSGYVIIHSGDLYKLSNDYKSVTEQVAKSIAPEFEAPSIFRKDSIYYWLGSHLSSWEKNDNYYYTATSLKGPWTSRGIFAPTGSLTWNSQTTFVLPIEGSKETTYLFMGDRWSFPKQASAATYVWQPLTVSGTTLSTPSYQDFWKINLSTGENSTTSISGKTIDSEDTKSIRYSGKWHHITSDTSNQSRSDEKDASFSLTYQGTQAGFYGLAGPDGGYARVVLLNSKGKTVLSSIIDFYCKYPVSALRFLTPVLAKDKYTLTVTAMGEKGNWSDKRKSNYGSTGYFISIDKAVVKE